MDEANLTMEEYIKVEAEKARRHGQTFNWETATYGKITYHEDINYFKDFETDFPAILFNDPLTTDHKISSESMIFLYDVSNINSLILRIEYSIVTGYSLHLYMAYLIFQYAVSDPQYEVEGYTDEVVHDFKQRLSGIFDRWVHRVQVLDFGGLTKEMGMSMDARLSMEHTDAQGQVVFTSHSWRRMFETRGPLVSFQLGGANRQMIWSFKVIAFKGDLRGYWDEIWSSKDFLTTVPSYIQIRDPLRRLCHRLIAHTIARRGQTPKKVTRTDLYFLRNIDQEVVNFPYLLVHYLFRHSDGRKRGAQMSGGHFITRLADHFGLLTEERLQGTTVVVGQLTEIDLDELSRQQVATDGALEDVEGAPAIDEGVQAIPAPNQAPQAPIAAPVMRTMPQRMARLEEEVYGLKESLGRGIA
ncbi:hypothetical protein Tco_1319038 [Tanacetum coccineum]